MNLQEHAELIMAVSALGISFVSILIGLFTFINQRRHFRITVRPIGQISLLDYPDHTGVYIKNVGVGPLVGERVRVKDGQGEAHDYLIELVPKPFGSLNFTNYSKMDEMVILPGKRVCLLELKGNDAEDKYRRFRGQLRESLKDISLELRYRDIYGKKMKTERKKLDWFNREVDWAK